VKGGGGIVATDEVKLAQAIRELLGDLSAYRNASDASENFVEENKGATDRIVDFIQEKRLLTN
jgi:3-deoxy-D-manno-octulosonic-acid transferase